MVTTRGSGDKKVCIRNSVSGLKCTCPLPTKLAGIILLTTFYLSQGLEDKSYSPSKSRAQENRSPSKSWLNARKRLPTTLSHDYIRGAGGLPELSQDTDHKRSQNLKTTIEGDENPPSRRKPLRSSPSPRTKRRETANRRPSKFVEGSMNDRVSNIPPGAYIGDEDAMEEYAAMSNTSQSAQNKKSSVDIVEADLDAGIESAKISGMSRFGRALANVLVKPVAAWQKFGGAREAKEQTANAEKNVMQARQLKAEKEYAELKRNGVLGTKAPPDVPTSLPVLDTTYEHVANEARPAPHRDSGIDVDGYCSSSDQKRNSQVDKVDEELIPPPVVPENVRALRSLSHVGSERNASSLSQASSTGLKPPPIPQTDRFAVPIPRETSPRKSSLHFRKPSLQTIKKVKSQIQLPTNKQYTETTISSFRDSDAAKAAGVGEHSPRKQPSRRDIAKQQRLSKKVSDLEVQLEIARRNLNQSIHKDFVDSNGSPQKGGSAIYSQKGQKTFSPDALPSLPSEGLLNKHISDDACQTGQGPGANTSRKFSGKKPADSLNCGDSTFPSAPAAQLKQEMQAQMPKGPRSKKRKSDEGLEDTRYEVVDGVEHPVANDAAKKPKLRRSTRNLKGVEGSDQAETKPVEHRKVKPVPPTPRNSPAKKAEALPPLPPAVTVLDPASIDQAKILSMRTSKNLKVPFGKHIEDISNLRKEFPAVSETQWAEYLGNLSADKKTTDHTSMAHHNEPVMTVLGRSSSRSVSPVKPPKMSDHEPFSTGQISPSRRLLTPIKDDEVLDTSTEEVQSGTDVEMASERTSNLRQSLLVKALEASRSINDKALPGIQKEDYVWPEDVF